MCGHTSMWRGKGCAPKSLKQYRWCRDKNGVAPNRADAADAFTQNLSHGSKIDSWKKVFLDSSVDFDGEATGTSLDVQYWSQLEIWTFEVEGGIKAVWVKKGLRMGNPGTFVTDKYQSGANVWYLTLPLLWTLASKIRTVYLFWILQPNLVRNWSL